MLIDALGQHLAIGGREEAVSLTTRDPKFWNVVSIRGPAEAKAPLVKPVRVHHALFDDAEAVVAGNEHQLATSEDLASIFRFVDLVGREPLLIHCQLGMSRSPAVALALICRRVAPRVEFMDDAVDILLSVRPKARPNLLVLRLGLACFMEMPVAAAYATALLEHPRVKANRFHSRQ